jgi:hypothetical protein
VDEGLAGLKRGFEKFFDSLKEFGYDFQFQAEMSEGKLVTKSKCPIKFRKWCESGCISFVTGFARAFGNIDVKVVSRQPESEVCIFEFEVIK